MSEQKKPIQQFHPKFSGTQPKLSEAELRKKCEELRNWGRWGHDDELGTLNYITPEHVMMASRLVRKGKPISMAFNFDENGPAFGRKGRFNPIHYMIRTGTDAYSGVMDDDGIRYADDAVIMPLQISTQWDALSHVFYDDYMWNGYDIRLVDSTGAKKNGIEKTKNSFIGRGVLLDVPRAHGVDFLPDGYAISSEELDWVAAQHGVEVGEGDIVIVRTGQLEGRLARGSWDFYSGGDAPGLAFETVDWIQDKQIAAICSDTYGVEAKPNPTDKIRQPWHWVVIPNMGLSMGEIFYLKDISEDCAADGVYEFMFTGPSLPVTGAVGSPCNPMAIK